METGFSFIAKLVSVLLHHWFMWSCISVVTVVNTKTRLHCKSTSYVLNSYKHRHCYKIIFVTIYNFYADFYVVIFIIIISNFQGFVNETKLDTQNWFLFH